jgi:hypothetical protein
VIGDNGSLTSDNRGAGESSQDPQLSQDRTRGEKVRFFGLEGEINVKFEVRNNSIVDLALRKIMGP